MLKLFFSLLLGLSLSWTRWWIISIYLTVSVLFFVTTVSLTESIKVVGFNIYLDTLSFSLCYLTLWLRVLILVARRTIFKTQAFAQIFSSLVFGLAFILMVSFLTSNFLIFYFFFEASLIPTLLIITGWGFQPERLQAGIYFILYTLTASLPLLAAIFYYYIKTGSLRMFTGWEMFIDERVFRGFLISLGLVGAFLVKIPIFLVHLWLPKAHVEAPVAGSMILAGVLLKLGGYGVCRVLGKFFYGFRLLSSYIIGLRLLGIIYVGVLCCRLNDIKALVAYSSVAHIGLVLAGVFRGFFWGISGGLIIIVSHGVSSSGLFCIVNIYYERIRRRRLYVRKGLIALFPRLAFTIFMLCGSNVSAPPTINLMSEIFLILRVLRYDTIIVLVFPVGSFLGAVFTFFLFSYSQHGKVMVGGVNLLPSKLNDYHSLVIHLIPLNFLVLKPEVFFLWL